ncbi:MAG: hypothetical protein BWK80_27545 [Desulfobacteraceae bacterium IS3]|nr:MAG: hypothetical protein BWK80_27545 [Desulfobacteraceae bacterium IS3]
MTYEKFSQNFLLILGSYSIKLKLRENRALYKLIGEFEFKRYAKKHRVYKNLADCPYQWKL